MAYATPPRPTHSFNKMAHGLLRNVKTLQRKELYLLTKFCPAMFMTAEEFILNSLCLPQSTWPFVPKQPVRTKLRCHIHNITDKWPNFHVHKMNGMQVQHTHICTLIGPAWFHFVPELLLYVSWTLSPSESLSLFYRTNAYTSPPPPTPAVCRQAACPAAREPSNLGAATGLQMPVSEFSPFPTARRLGDLRPSPVVAALTARQRRLQARMFEKKIISFQLPVGFLPHLNDFLLIV